MEAEQDPAVAQDNDSEQPNPVGRPLKFKTVEDLELAIQNYFAECDPHTEKTLVEVGRDSHDNMLFDSRLRITEQKPYTVSGLARSLGIDRDTLINYKKRDEFIGSIQAAYDRCHEYAESQLFGRAQAGAAFSLKNNWGWKDRTEVENNHTGNVSFVNDVPRPKTGNAEP
ncbi:terminase small subunit [Naasia lichenicola]|uniref:Uncharacterized protein n=1 Tax=Naasia lichenicola TaxID=2565933 RepID=A0A4S4FMM7_9MICO|nr:terminase small subunit [Naasia lichenicola]THG30685.1 hypothetical protein E6C64_08575 [Naasia lichenicola]THG31922.1 hypothetical protein E6C64_07720 [Naasia lichenicola]